MLNYLKDFENYVYALNNTDKFRLYSKWIPVFEQRIKMNNSHLNEMLSLLFEFYSNLEHNYIFGGRLPSVMSTFNNDDFMTCNECVDFINDKFDYYYNNSPYSKLKIKYEYINILTNKKGIMLEQDIKYENNEIIDKNIKNKIDNDCRLILNECIQYILNPEFRKNSIRLKKLNNILNN